MVSLKASLTKNKCIQASFAGFLSINKVSWISKIETMIRISHQILNHFTHNGHVNFFHILFTLKNEEWLYVKQRKSDKIYDQDLPTTWFSFINRKKNGHSLELKIKRQKQTKQTNCCWSSGLITLLFGTWKSEFKRRSVTIDDSRKLSPPTPPVSHI